MIRHPNRAALRHPKKARQRGTKTTYPMTIFSRLRVHRWRNYERLEGRV